MTLADFIPEEGQRRIAQAITEAEQLTSGELCVHVTPYCRGELMERARRTFDRLHLYRTRQRNAVLIYVAFIDRCFAILGDQGINDRVPQDFWDDAVAMLKRHLQAGLPVDGICEAIKLIGRQLAEIFPIQDDDVNELSNEVTFDNLPEDEPPA